MRFVGLLLLLALAGCAQPGLAERHESLRVCADGPTVDGIDVSHWQGTIDWDAVAGTSVEFVFMRVANGTTVDDTFARNWSEARRVGILRGAYQYFHPNLDPIAQADLLLSTMGPLEPGDLPPVIDVETADGLGTAAVQAAVEAWVAHVAARVGRPPIVYTGPNFWRTGAGAFDARPSPLWIANYGVTCPDVPEQWTRWDFFQTSDTGSVAGIAGNVDTDLWNGTLDALRAFAGGTVSCGDGFCSTGEDHATCPGDCPICEPIPPPGRTVEEDELCFEPTGPASGWRTVTGEGSGGSLVWTHCIDGASENVAFWHFDFAEAGRYRVEVYTPAPYNESRMAPYTVRHGGTEDRIALDQMAVSGWQTLGEYTFAAGPDQWLRIEDGSGEPLSTMTQEVLDAVRVTRLDLPLVDAGGPADAGVVPGDAIVGGDGGPRAPLSSGCACRAGAPRSSVPLALLALAPLLLSRRRRS